MLSDRTEAASSHHSAAAPLVRHMSAGSERACAYAFAIPSTASGNFSRGSTASFSGSAVGSGRSTAEAAEAAEGEKKRKKPLFRPASDDTKPVLRDPISRSDPVETEQSVLRLPPFP